MFINKPLSVDNGYSQASCLLLLTIAKSSVNKNYQLLYILFYYFLKVTQLIPPRPQLTRGKPFPLSGSEDWFIYPQGKNVYLYNLKDSSVNQKSAIII